MGTKLNPGDYDCYANAKDDEPMFVLLARDLLAPWLTRLWAAVKYGDEEAFDALLDEGMGGLTPKPVNPAKRDEALSCATRMEVWKKENPDV